MSAVGLEKLRDLRMFARLGFPNLRLEAFQGLLISRCMVSKLGVSGLWLRASFWVLEVVGV